MYVYTYKFNLFLIKEENLKSVFWALLVILMKMLIWREFY